MAPSFGDLLEATRVEALVRSWLAEDIPSFDYGGAVVGTAPREARLLAKADGVICGRPFFDAVFAALGCTVEWHAAEGSVIERTQEKATGKVLQHVATVRGAANKILIGERTALNTLARASGIATLAHRAAAVKAEQQWHGAVAGTRKTTPGFRLVEKYALLVGGADTHRHDLSSMIMLKDNHLDAHGSITEAIGAARQVGGFALKIEVECRSQADAEEALKAGAEIVMLDNFAGADAQQVARSLKAQFPHATIEASGTLTLETLPAYMCEAIDVLSMGSLTQSVPHIDFSLKIVT